MLCLRQVITMFVNMIHKELKFNNKGFGIFKGFNINFILIIMMTLIYNNISKQVCINK
jgi:hypothetical protein